MINKFAHLGSIVLVGGCTVDVVQNFKPDGQETGLFILVKSIFVGEL